jgi:AraC-like DNA-binding protein
VTAPALDAAPMPRHRLVRYITKDEAIRAVWDGPIAQLALDAGAPAETLWRLSLIAALSGGGSKMVCEKLDLGPSTLLASLARARLFYPKQLTMRWGGILLPYVTQEWGYTLADAAHLCEWSSPQSMVRMVRDQFGMSASTYVTVKPWQERRDLFAQMLTEQLRNWKRWRFPTPKDEDAYPAQLARRALAHGQPVSGAA